MFQVAMFLKTGVYIYITVYETTDLKHPNLTPPHIN